MVSLEELVPANHIYRKFKELWDFTEIEKEMDKMSTSKWGQIRGAGQLE